MPRVPSLYMAVGWVMTVVASAGAQPPPDDAEPPPGDAEPAAPAAEPTNVGAEPTVAPAKPKPASITLPAWKVNAILTLELDASKDAFADVISIAPDVALGVTDDLTLAIVHSTFGRTGFRGNAGGGLCITDDCPQTYPNAGLEALYALTKGPLASAANVGLHATSFENEHYSLKLGGKLRHVMGKLTIASMPSVFIALTRRDAEVENRDRLFIPVSGTYALPAGFSVGLGTGLKGPFEGFGGEWEVALGAFGQYALSPTLGFGASWVHGRFLGGDDLLPDGSEGIDSRAIHVWVTATL